MSIRTIREYYEDTILVRIVSYNDIVPRQSL